MKELRWIVFWLLGVLLLALAHSAPAVTTNITSKLAPGIWAGTIGGSNVLVITPPSVLRLSNGDRNDWPAGGSGTEKYSGTVSFVTGLLTISANGATVDLAGATISNIVTGFGYLTTNAANGLYLDLTTWGLTNTALSQALGTLTTNATAISNLTVLAQSRADSAFIHGTNAEAQTVIASNLAAQANAAGTNAQDRVGILETNAVLLVVNVFGQPSNYVVKSGTVLSNFLAAGFTGNCSNCWLHITNGVVVSATTLAWPAGGGGIGTFTNLNVQGNNYPTSTVLRADFVSGHTRDAVLVWGENGTNFWSPSSRWWPQPSHTIADSFMDDPDQGFASVDATLGGGAVIEANAWNATHDETVLWEYHLDGTVYSNSVLVAGYGWPQFERILATNTYPNIGPPPDYTGSGFPAWTTGFWYRAYVYAITNAASAGPGNRHLWDGWSGIHGFVTNDYIFAGATNLAVGLIITNGWLVYSGTSVTAAASSSLVVASTSGVTATSFTISGIPAGYARLRGGWTTSGATNAAVVGVLRLNGDAAAAYHQLRVIAGDTATTAVSTNWSQTGAFIGVVRTNNATGTSSGTWTIEGYDSSVRFKIVQSRDTEITGVNMPGGAAIISRSVDSVWVSNGAVSSVTMVIPLSNATVWAECEGKLQ